MNTDVLTNTASLMLAILQSQMVAERWHSGIFAMRGIFYSWVYSKVMQQIAVHCIFKRSFSGSNMFFGKKCNIQVGGSLRNKSLNLKMLI